MAEDQPVKVAAMILAAGASRRMGKPKLLLPWHQGTVLEHLICQWRSLGIRQVGAVLASGDEAIGREADRLGIQDRITNPHPERGMFSSIQCAAAWPGWDAGTTHWALSLGDQPQVRTGTLRRLLGLSRECPGKICQPSRNGRPRHPVIFPRALLEALMRSRSEHLKAFLREREGDRVTFPSDDEGLDVDLDTPEDYRRIAERFGGATTEARGE